jgi:hypothetical protein
MAKEHRKNGVSTSDEIVSTFTTVLACMHQLSSSLLFTFTVSDLKTFKPIHMDLLSV